MVLTILGEFTEIPESVKLRQLSRLINGSENEESKELFQKLLTSLPVEKVRAKIQIQIQNMSPIQVNNTNVRDYGTLLQDAVSEDKRDFIRILMDSGFVSFLTVALIIDKIFGR